MSRDQVPTGAPMSTKYLSPRSLQGTMCWGGVDGCLAEQFPDVARTGKGTWGGGSLAFLLCEGFREQGSGTPGPLLSHFLCPVSLGLHGAGNERCPIFVFSKKQALEYFDDSSSAIREDGNKGNVLQVQGKEIGDSTAAFQERNPELEVYLIRREMLNYSKCAFFHGL